MLRRALLLSVALGVLGCTDAWAARTTLPVRGDVHAIAFAGDAVIVARERQNGSFGLERLTPGAPAQTLLRLADWDEDNGVALKASPQALAFSTLIGGNNDNVGANHVFVGSPAGPLREVASCAAGLVVPPIDVSGSRVAWASGGCGEPAARPIGASAATIVIGGADPAAPLRLVGVPPEAVPITVVLDGATGLAGLVRASLFVLFKSEVRRLGVSQLGATVTKEDGGTVLPIGVLRNGDTVYSLDRSYANFDANDGSTECPRTLFALSPGSAQRRPLPLGDCPPEQIFALPVGDAQTAGDRVYALVAKGDGEEETPESVSLKSARGDGSAVQLLARGTRRTPQGFSVAESGRLAWWQPACAGGSEIVIDDGTTGRPAAIPSCRLKVLNHSAHVRRGQITLRLSCPYGCKGEAFAGRPRGDRALGSFSLKPGTHRVRLRLTRSERRRKQLRVGFEVDLGPGRAVNIRLR